MEQKNIAGFDCIEVGKGQKENLVICFHGYGADFRDLAPLAMEVPLAPNTYWIFPNGPKQVPIGPGYYGRAWFDIDMRALEEAMMRGTHRDLSDWKPQQLESLLGKLKGFFEEVLPQYKKVLIGGFSQGAMLSTELVLSQMIKPQGLFILSGNMVNQKEWLPKMKECPKTPIFQSHGEQDQVLGYKYAQSLQDHLEDNDFVVEFHAFRGGHEIPRNVLQQLSSWGKNQLR